VLGKKWTKTGPRRLLCVQTCWLKWKSLLCQEQHTANHVVDQYKTRIEYFNFEQNHLYYLLQYNALKTLRPISVFYKAQWQQDVPSVVTLRNCICVQICWLKWKSLLCQEQHAANHVVDQYKTRTEDINFKQNHLYHLLQYNALKTLRPISIFYKAQW